MFQNFYHLQEQPFGVNPDPRFLYLSKTHREAFSSLLYRVQIDSGFLAMAAQPGMGKTTLLFHLLHQLQPKARTAFIFQTQCTPHEFLRHLLSEFNCDTGMTDTVRMSQELKSILLSEANADRRCVVLIDEAQNLQTEVLETVRLLSDFETPRRKLLQIILSGQPELEEKLTHPSLRQLRQRLSCIIHIDRFTSEETAIYMAHRLRIAGYPGRVPDLFDSPALARIAELSQGIPRVINSICFNALSLGFALEKRRISRSIIEEVARDLGLANKPWSDRMDWKKSDGVSLERSDTLFPLSDYEEGIEAPAAHTTIGTEHAQRQDAKAEPAARKLETVMHDESPDPQSEVRAPVATVLPGKSPGSAPTDAFAKKLDDAELEAAKAPIPISALPTVTHDSLGRPRLRRILNRSFLMRRCTCLLVLWVVPSMNVPTRRDVSHQKPVRSVGDSLLPGSGPICLQQEYPTVAEGKENSPGQGCRSGLPNHVGKASPILSRD
jgi:general secretion pathway protein A